MSPSEEQGSSASIFPVSVIVERQQVQHGRWTMPRWEAVGVVASENAIDTERQKTLIHSDGKSEQYLWTGFSIELFKDGGESYWYNLVARNPSLYVVCEEGDEAEITPFLVLADYAEANMHAEADDLVCSVPMPPEIYQWLERFVMNNYVPKPKKKRKRKDWMEESAYGRGSEDRPHGRR
ncbi:MAG: DUF3305 domain-containing protein [Nitrospira sp.]|nr:DUF3305 domain-containing protein [Nitrospira sp.]